MKIAQLNLRNNAAIAVICSIFGANTAFAVCSSAGCISDSYPIQVMLLPPEPTSTQENIENAVNTILENLTPTNSNVPNIPQFSMQASLGPVVTDGANSGSNSPTNPGGGIITTEGSLNDIQQILDNAVASGENQQATLGGNLVTIQIVSNAASLLDNNDYTILTEYQ